MDIETLVNRTIAQINFPKGSELPQEQLVDKIKGLIFGNAIGDSLGIMTECFSADDSKRAWEGKEWKLMNSISPRDFPVGDWSDDTDQMILLIQCYLEENCLIPSKFAEKLVVWKNHGFAELGDTQGIGIGFTTKQVLEDENYNSNPFHVASKVWIIKNGISPNGSLMRTSVLGAINYKDIRKVLKQTIEASITTHPDPRGVTSCVVITSTIALLLQGVEENLVKETSLNIGCVFLENYSLMFKEYLMKNFLDTGMMVYEMIENDVTLEVLRRYASGRIDECLPLDKKDMGYSYKCLGCAIWAFEQNNWLESMQRIILEGGDTDTNAAVSGALLGCKLGFGNLPQDMYNELIHRDWLLEKVDALIEIIKISD